MIKSINIFGYDVNFVSHTAWNTTPRRRQLDFNEYRLGFWYKRNMAVKQFDIETHTSPKSVFSQFVPTYYIGVDLIWIRLWINFDKDVLKFDLDEKV